MVGRGGSSGDTAAHVHYKCRELQYHPKTLPAQVAKPMRMEQGHVSFAVCPGGYEVRRCDFISTTN